MSNATRSLSDGPIGEHIAATIITSFGVLLNFGSLVVMLTNFTRIFGTVESCFVANLAFADLLTCLGGLLWGISGFALYPPPDVRVTLLCIMWVTVAASFLTLLCMGCERVMVVVSPMKAQRYFKKPLAYICCGGVWFISILCGCMIIVNQPVTLFFMTVMFEVSLITTIICYAVIYFTIKRLRSVSETAKYNAKTATTSLELDPENESIIHHRVTVRQESRVTNMVFILVVMLVITVLPYMILLQVNVSYLLFCQSCKIREILQKALSYMFPIELLNFTLNPVVYAWRLPKFRQASKKTFRRFACCKSLQHTVNTEGITINSDSDDSGSLDNGPATIFTGGEHTSGTPLNQKNRRS